MGEGGGRGDYGKDGPAQALSSRRAVGGCFAVGAAVGSVPVVHVAGQVAVDVVVGGTLLARRTVGCSVL